MHANPLPWGELESMAKRFFAKPEALKPRDEHFGTLKLNGTNLAKSAFNGRLFGRRHFVGNDSYCSTDVKFLRAETQVSQVPAALSRAMDPLVLDEKSCSEFLVYGELGCLKECLYSASQAHYGQWKCFGVVFQLLKESPVSAKQVQEALLRGNFRFRATKIDRVGELSGRFTVFLSPPLIRIFEECGVPTVPILFRGPLVEWVERAAAWLSNPSTGELEEGLVVVAPRGAFKWKSRYEVQVRDPFPSDDRTAGLNEEHLKILRCLKLVIDAADPPGPGGPPSIKSSLTTLRSRESEEQQKVVASAISKLDSSLISYFDLLPPKKVTEMVQEECLLDWPEQPVPPRIALSLKKMAGQRVGKAYSQWIQNRSFDGGVSPKLLPSA